MPTPETKITNENWEKAVEHLDNVEQYYKGFMGKPKHNPFVILQEVIPRFRTALDDPETKTSDLYYKIMELKKTPPIIADINKPLKPISS